MSVQEEMQRAGYRKGNIQSTNTCIRCKYKKRGRYDGEVGCGQFQEFVGENDTCDYFIDIRYTPEYAEKLRKMGNFYQSMEKSHSNTNSVGKIEESKKNEGCYIATAVYGGYDMPEVLVLRKFRDEILKKSFLGRLFIKVYYGVSPKMARKLKNHMKINQILRKVLDKLVLRVKTKLG